MKIALVGMMMSEREEMLIQPHQLLGGSCSVPLALP
jgi:hypothetical protein